MLPIHTPNLKINRSVIFIILKHLILSMKNAYSTNHVFKNCRRFVVLFVANSHLYGNHPISIYLCKYIKVHYRIFIVNRYAVCNIPSFIILITIYFSRNILNQYFMACCLLRNIQSLLAYTGNMQSVAFQFSSIGCIEKCFGKNPIFFSF